MSIDPLIPSIADPQSHNAYGYVRNNPINRVDPSGMTFNTVFGRMKGKAPKSYLITARNASGDVVRQERVSAKDVERARKKAKGSKRSSEASQSEGPAFDKAVSKAISDVRSELRGVNEKGGLLFNPDRTNRPIGSVVSKETVGIPFINEREVFVNSRPNQFVPRGLDFKGDGFIGGCNPSEMRQR